MLYYKILKNSRVDLKHRKEKYMANYRGNRSGNRWNNKNGKNRRNSGKSNWKNRSNSNARELTDFARKMGMVKRGLENPDSRITEAFNRGKMRPEKRSKKPLF